MCGLICFIILALVAVLSQVCCYFEVEMTEGRAICGESNAINLENLKVKRLNRTNFALVGTIDVNVDFDDSYEIISNLYKKQGNEYRLTAFHVGPHKFCDYIQNKALFYDTAMDCTDLPQRKNCPWKKSTYNFNKCLIPTDKVPQFLNGDYRVDVKIMKKREVAGGYQIFFYVINL